MDEKTPAIIISANVDLDTIKNAYSKGCDEYIKKPFYIYELETKLKKLCIKEQSEVNLKDGFIYNISKETLYENNELVKLAKKEILLMTLFVKNYDKVVTFEQIEQYVWQGDLTTNENIRALVKRLRKNCQKILFFLKVVWVIN